jgi:hypothetical protein
VAVDGLHQSRRANGRRRSECRTRAGPRTSEARISNQIRANATVTSRRRLALAALPADCELAVMLLHFPNCQPHNAVCRSSYTPKIYNNSVSYRPSVGAARCSGRRLQSRKLGYSASRICRRVDVMAGFYRLHCWADAPSRHAALTRGPGPAGTSVIFWRWA